MKFRLVALHCYQEQRDLYFVIREPSRIKGGLKYWVNLGVKTCDISLFCMLMLGFGLMVYLKTLLFSIVYVICELDRFL